MIGALVDAITVRNLEVARVLEVVATRAASEPARIRIRALGPIADPGALDEMRRRVGEVMALLGVDRTSGPQLPASLDLGFLDELGPVFSRLERGGVLEGPEVLRVASLIPPVLALSSLVGRDPDRLEALGRLLAQGSLGHGSRTASLSELGLEVDAALDESGAVKDSASPELRRVRRRATELRTHLGARARRLMETYAEHLQDEFYTLREDRYVLPVRSDSRTGVPGIIHGTSNSGATLFIEPHALVEDCNELKIAESEALAREREVLMSLSGRLAAHAPELRGAHDVLVTLDVLMAVARFGHDASAILPELSDEPVLHLVGARHPLLVLAGVEVIPNDVSIRSGKGWVVSGPNAGGKTVLIKTVGLTALMSYMGLPVSVGGGSIVGRFDHIRAEIGDSQSLESNLSTFSAQVASLASIMGEVHEGSLVVLDELAAGTDPSEGAALAEAILAELLDLGCAVLVATHFDTLKRLSIEHERLVAAGMGLDLETLSPTFRLHVGMPGSSGGLLVAERFGMPTRVIERARQVLSTGHSPEQECRLEALERLRTDLERKLDQAEKLESRLRSREIGLEKKERELTESQRRAMQAEQRFLTTELVVLRSELKHAHKVLRRRPLDHGTVHATESVARKVGAVLAPGGPISRAASPEPVGIPVCGDDLVAGETVIVPSLGLTGSVARVEGRKVRIVRDGVSWTVDLEAVHRPQPGGPGGGGDVDMDETPKTPPRGEDQEDWQSSYNTIDLRGRGLDEAQIDLDGFIDDALEMGIEQVFVIHGHGAGVLKNGLRRYLRHLKKVQSFRPGKREEGGDGVTVCVLQPR